MMNETIFYSWFTSEFLQKEFNRLFEMFVPHESPLDVRVVVGEEAPNGEAAHALLGLGIVVMYADYHIRRPQEYKMTLLHEAGHFLFKKTDHSNFPIYFSLLEHRQKFIEESVIPKSLEDFIYCSSLEDKGYTFACGGCGERVNSSHANVRCTSCRTNMLLVGGL
jgi:hypothetical protein